MQAPENILWTISWIIGGLGLFLFGIDLMGRSLRKAAGATLRKSLGSITKTRFHGLLTGTVVTALVNSSSATTVMIVGFITAGLMTFSQSIGVILGANIGATFIPYLTLLDLDQLAIPLIGFGFLFNFISKRRVLRKLGLACMGFGMLFLGLVFMKTAVNEYRDVISGWFEFCAAAGFWGRFMAFFIAALATAVIQSSGATIIMTVALASTGAINDLGVAIAIILGANIGTCITAMLASIKAPRSGKKAAVAHLVFNVVGALITLLAFKLYMRYIPLTAHTLPHQIANCNMIIKTINALIFLPFTVPYARFISFLVGGDDKLNVAPEYLNYTDIKSPARAFVNVKKEIKRMCRISLDITRDSVAAFFTHDEMEQESVLEREDVIDDLYQCVADYVVDVSKQEIPSEISALPSTLMAIMNDVERLGDHAENIVETSQAFTNKDARLTDGAKGNIRNLLSLINEMGEKVLLLFDKEDPGKLNDVYDIRDKLKEEAQAAYRKHELRVTDSRCTPVGGIVFIEIMTDLLRVGNHLRNIAVSLSLRNEISERAEI